MGAKRKVDAKLYDKVKKELNTPDDDQYVMAKFNLGQTTVRAIRTTSSYNQFLVKTSGKKEPVIEKREYKVNPKTKKSKKVKKEYTPQEQAQLAWRGFVGIAIVGFLALFILFLIWIFIKVIGG